MGAALAACVTLGLGATPASAAPASEAPVVTVPVVTAPASSEAFPGASVAGEPAGATHLPPNGHTVRPFDWWW